MSWKRIFGMLVVIAGVVLLYISNEINNRIAEGEQQIASAKKKVAQGDQLFSLNPISKEIGAGITNSANKKIDAGEETIAHYAQVALWCQNGGIGLIVLGAIAVIFGRKSSKR